MSLLKNPYGTASTVFLKPVFLETFSAHALCVLPVLNSFLGVKAKIFCFCCFFFSGSQFYLVLDVTNLTSQEMTLNYTPNKTILIEAKESCRFPVPVARCDLDELLAKHIPVEKDDSCKSHFRQTNLFKSC